MSRRLTVSAFFDHQVNTPLVSNAPYPTSNSNYGIAFNLSLARRRSWQYFLNYSCRYCSIMLILHYSIHELSMGVILI